MNNLTQTQQDAKQAYLDNQRQQMFDQYKNAGANERGAIIRQIEVV